MVGQPLVDLLLQKGANVTVVSLDDPSRMRNKDVKFVQADLRDFSKCLDVTKDQQVVFHVAGIKGSPTLTRDKPASFFVPMLQFNANVMEAARINEAEWTLYTSTVGVYGPADVFKEDDLWSQSPSKNDWYAGWAKRIGEMQLEAYRVQYKKANFSIVRPVNIHGPLDGFNPQTSMVIPSLISRAIDSKDKLTIWGDGSPVRDFINSKDVARAMIFCVENEISQPVNVGSGKGTSIKELAEIIISHIPHNLEIEWDTTKPNGDAYRVADISRLKSYGFELSKTLDESIAETIKWYLENKEEFSKRYDQFLQK